MSINWIILPETDIARENWWFQDYFHFEKAYLFSGAMLVWGAFFGPPHTFFWPPHPAFFRPPHTSFWPPALLFDPPRQQNARLRKKLAFVAWQSQSWCPERQMFHEIHHPLQTTYHVGAARRSWAGFKTTFQANTSRNSILNASFLRIRPASTKSLVILRARHSAPGAISHHGKICSRSATGHNRAHQEITLYNNHVLCLVYMHCCWQGRMCTTTKTHQDISYHKPVLMLVSQGHTASSRLPIWQGTPAAKHIGAG